MAYSYETADPCLYNKLSEFAKNNRKFPTEAESYLWNFIRGKQLGLPFRRQHIIGDYIADFACLPAKLIIELDGGYHGLPQQVMNDEQRTRWLESRGFEVVRFSNEEILGSIHEVLDIIKNNILRKVYDQ